MGACNPDTGTCSNLCAGSSCIPGKTCDLDTGRCVDDICLTVRCPAGSRCEAGSCVVPPPDETPDGGPDPDDGGPDRPDTGPQSDAGPDQIVLVTGGGGCTCNAGAARTAAPLATILMVLGLMVAVLRRR
jgi:hypothetical protein